MSEKEQKNLDLKLTESENQQKKIMNRTWSFTSSKVVEFKIFVGNFNTKISFMPNIGQQFVVWDSSVVLSRFLEANPPFVLDKTIIELGCGVGLPGMVSAVLKAKKVLLTDLPLFLDNSSKIVEENGLSSKIKTISLEWGKKLPDEIENSVFDLILMSDLIYAGDESTTKKLCKTIINLNSMTILNCFERRFNSTASIRNLKLLEETLKTNGYNITKGKVPESVRDEFISLHIYKKERN